MFSTISCPLNLIIEAEGLSSCLKSSYRILKSKWCAVLILKTVIDHHMLCVIWLFLLCIDFPFFKKNLKVYFCMCTCIHVILWSMLVPTEYQERSSDAIEPELQAVLSLLMWVLGTEKKSFLTTVSPCNYWAIYHGVFKTLNFAFIGCRKISSCLLLM